MLFNEPKLLKLRSGSALVDSRASFSALQRAEIAEILRAGDTRPALRGFSALQRAEIAEMNVALDVQATPYAFQCSSTSRNC